MTPTFFETAEAFREWLVSNHEKETELLVGFYKVDSGKPSMTWSQSVDQALCFGWIDGIRKSIDKESYTIRFTPRKKNSIWSAVNIKKMEELTKAGLMTAAGEKAFSLRTAEKSYIYSHENGVAEFPAEYEALFKANTLAWAFFEKQAPSYKKIMKHWIMSAKRKETQLTRLEKTIKESEQQKRML